jgi:ubiquitin-protein ligase
MARIAKELANLALDPLDGFDLLYDQTKTSIQGFFIGPDSTPYTGGLFCFTIKYPEDSLEREPVVRVETPILHPGILKGRVCIVARWLPNRTLKWVLQQLKFMLQQPNFDDCVNLEAVEMYRAGKFEQKARELTLTHSH